MLLISRREVEVLRDNQTLVMYKANRRECQEPHRKNSSAEETLAIVELEGHVTNLQVKVGGIGKSDCKKEEFESAPPPSARIRAIQPNDSPTIDSKIASGVPPNTSTLRISVG